jgi:hypothetical protein
MLNQIFDPPIKTKIQVMERQVGWGHPLLRERQIDQTCCVIGDAGQGRTAFAFLVMGDTDIGAGRQANLPQAMAAAMREQLAGCQFVLHMGDVAYPIGAAEYYLQDFLQPYCRQLQADGVVPGPAMTFSLPILPVPGNHDYYDRGGWQRLAMQLMHPLQRWCQSRLGWAIGWPGSHQGRVYAETFLDCLAQQPTTGMLAEHLAQHYTAKTHTGYCLQYEPGQFTRLPNRYYHFRYGGVDFFALDSNTFTQVAGKTSQPIDEPQLQWLRHRLIASWADSTVQGRMIYLHHAPYTTEAAHHDQPEVLAVRRNLRWVLDQVAEAVGERRGDRPLVDLILGGHAHCFEHVRTLNTGHADAHLDWIVCGGSGMSVRSQRPGGSDITEMIGVRGRKFIKPVARSQVFIGKARRQRQVQLQHSFVRVEVQVGEALQLVLRPFVLEQVRQSWVVREVDRIVI